MPKIRLWQWIGIFVIFSYLSLVLFQRDSHPQEKCIPVIGEKSQPVTANNQGAIVFGKETIPKNLTRKEWEPLSPREQIWVLPPSYRRPRPVQRGYKCWGTDVHMGNNL